MSNRGKKNVCWDTDGEFVSVALSDFMMCGCSLTYCLKEKITHSVKFFFSLSFSSCLAVKSWLLLLPCCLAVIKQVN